MGSWKQRVPMPLRSLRYPPNTSLTLKIFCQHDVFFKAPANRLKLRMFPKELPEGDVSDEEVGEVSSIIPYIPSLYGYTFGFSGSLSF